MKVFELEAALFEFYNRSLAFDYDNVGLLVGDKDAEISGVVVALDCTDSAIRLAENTGANLIVTHHPVIFEGMKSVLSDSTVFTLIKKGISVISMHTNLDAAVGGVNDNLCKVIGLKNTEGLFPISDGYEIRKGELDTPLSADEFARHLKEKLDCSVRYSCGGKEIKRVAVCGGSGSSLLYDLVSENVDGFVTAEVKHHTFYDAARAGISIFDCGHFDTEDIVIEPLAEKIRSVLCKPVHTVHQSEIKVI